MGKADLHIHSIYSDGTDSAAELIEIMKRAGISVFSVTDHDGLGFYDNRDYELPEGMVIIPGIEFSCIADGIKCHILGYGMDTDNALLRKAVADGGKLREKKLDIRLNCLFEKHGIRFDEKEVDELRKIPSAGKPHIARKLIEHGYGDTVAEVIKKYLTGMPGENDRIDAKYAVDAIVASGGVPVWAHPLGGEGEKRLEKREFRKRFYLLKKYGIQGLECFYSRYSLKEEEYLASVAEKNRLLITGGSDYHGRNKDILPGMLGEVENAVGRVTLIHKFKISMNDK